MDSLEADNIIQFCSPNYKSSCNSPAPSVSSYSVSKKMVKQCKNCCYAYRTEFKPNSEYCSKGEAYFRSV